MCWVSLNFLFSFLFERASPTPFFFLFFSEESEAVISSFARHRGQLSKTYGKSFLSFLLPRDLTFLGAFSRFFFLPLPRFVSFPSSQNFSAIALSFFKLNQTYDSPRAFSTVLSFACRVPGDVSVLVRTPPFPPFFAPAFISPT